MNEVKQTKDKGKWLFASKQYEHWDMVEFNKFKRISNSVLRDLDDYTRKRVYAYWNDIRYPQGNLIYVNHDKNNNCEVQRHKLYLILVANQTIHKWEELTIDYWEYNDKF